MPDLLLHNTSIVLVGDNSEPGKLNAGFLIQNGIFPPALPITQSVTIPPISDINYADGYRFQAHERRTVFRHDYAPPVAFGDWTGDLIEDAAIRFLEVSPELQLSALGVNMEVTVSGVTVAPLFSSEATARPLEFLDLTCRAEVEGFTYLQLKLETAVIMDTTPGVKASANFHLGLAGADSSESAKAAISRRLELATVLTEILNEIQFGHSDTVVG